MRRTIAALVALVATLAVVAAAVAATTAQSHRQAKLTTIRMVQEWPVADGLLPRQRTSPSVVCISTK